MREVWKVRQSSAHPAPVSEDNGRGGGNASVGAQQHDAQVAQDAAHDDDVVHVGAGHFNEPANAQRPVFRKSGEAPEDFYECGTHLFPFSFLLIPHCLTHLPLSVSLPSRLSKHTSPTKQNEGR